MEKGSGTVSLFVLLMLISSSFVVSITSIGAKGNGQDHQNDDITPEGLLEWAKAHPRSYTPDGREIPFDGTTYFLNKGTTQSRDIGSRALGSCSESGGTWDAQGGGTHSNLFVRANTQSYPNATTRQALINEFDNRIWPTDTTVFGAAFMTKIDMCVYYMDGAGGVGGYFNPWVAENIYVDSADIDGWGYQIIAHEFQHLLHQQLDSNEDLWLNEGCADLAILLNYGGNASGILNHIWAFSQNPDNDLTVWDDQVYDYGTAFSYIAYLWEHFGGNATIKSLVANVNNGMSSISTVLNGKGYAETATDVFYRWAVANIVDDTSFDSKKWGYDSIDIRLGSSPRQFFPDSGNGQTNNWAAEYYTFTNNGPAQQLKITFNAQSGSLKAYLAAIGRFGTGNVSKVIPITTGSATVDNFGIFGSYNKVYLIVAGANPGGSFSWSSQLIDTIPPTTTFDIFPQLPDTLDGWYTTRPTVSLTADEPGTIYYRLDNGTDLTYTGPIKVPDGAHIFHYHSVDTSKNAEIEHSYPVKVDSTKPTTTLLIDPAIPDGQNSWYVTVPNITLKSSKIAKTYFSWDNGAYQNYTVPLQPAEGAHVLKYYSQDLHGNKEDAKKLDLKVDSKVPMTKAQMTPANASGKDGWYIATPSVRLTTDPDAVTFYWWDGSTESEYYGDLIAVDGNHTLNYYSKDDAGNREKLRTLRIKVDTTIPESGYNIEPSSPNGENGWYNTKPTVTLEVTEDFSSTIYYRFDKQDYALYEDDIKAPDGDHVLNWYAVDPAGNAENEHTQEILVDTTIPLTTLTVAPDKVSTEWYTAVPDMQLNVSEKNAKILYHWDYNMDSTFTGTLVIPDGKHVLYYHAMDDAGNKEAEKHREIQLDTRPPTALLNGPVAPEQGSAGTFDGTGSKSSIGIVSYFFDFGDGKNSGWISSPTTSHTFNSASKYTVSLKVKDKAGLVSDPQTMLVSVRSKPTGGGGWLGGGDDDGTNGTSAPFYRRVYTIAGFALPFLLIVLILLILLIVMIAVVVAVVKRRRRIAREKALKEAEPVERVTVREEDDDRAWRPRREGDPSYSNEPSIRHTEPYEFGYPSYVAMDDQVEAVQMSEPLDKGRVEGPGDMPPTPMTKPAPPPKAAPAPAKVVAPAAKPVVAQPAVAQPKPKPAVPAQAPKPQPQPKKKTEDVDVDSQISDLLSRLGP
jgi:hypothetical protein